MVGIVEGIQEIFMKRMNILESRKAVQYQRELFRKCFLGVFDLPSIEI